MPIGIYPRKLPAERFWDKVKKGEGCWEWTAGAMPNGYGKFWINGKTVGAHRVSWELSNGPIGVGLEVLHRCDNKICVNPEHLFVGTQKDNVMDCFAKGRRIVPKGEEHYGAKLSVLTVKKIRLFCERDEMTEDRAARVFGVSTSTVQDVLAGRTWKHVIIDKEGKDGWDRDIWGY